MRKSSLAAVTERYKEKCVLGSKACQLALNICYETEVCPTINAACENCPNPTNPIKAVKCILDFTDSRKEAVDNVDLWVLENDEALPVKEVPIHLVEDPEKGDYHVFSFEGLQALNDYSSHLIF